MGIPEATYPAIGVLGKSFRVSLVLPVKQPNLPLDQEIGASALPQPRTVSGNPVGTCLGKPHLVGIF